MGVPRGGPGHFVGPSGRSGTGWGIIGEVLDGSKYTRADFGRVGGPSRRFGTVCWTLREVQDGLEDPQGGPGWVGGPSGRPVTSRGNFGEV